MVLRKELWAAGMRYRKNLRGLPGTPDLVFTARRLAVFVHGCFWHRHPGCRYATTPKTNTAFWAEKFAANVARDHRKVEELGDLGWRCLIVWGCETRDAASLAEVVERIGAALGRRGPRATTPVLRKSSDRCPAVSR